MDQEKFKNVLIDIPKEDKMVRTSFNISYLAVEAIKELTNNYKFTVNKIFELFLKDASLVEYAAKDETTVLSRYSEMEDKVTKAYAVSESTRNSLNKIAKKYEIKRDRLIERSIIIFKEILTIRIKNKIEKFNQALELINKLNNEAGQVYDKVSELVGGEENEPEIIEAVGNIWGSCDEAINEIETSRKEYEDMLIDGSDK